MPVGVGAFAAGVKQTARDVVDAATGKSRARLASIERQLEETSQREKKAQEQRCEEGNRHDEETKTQTDSFSKKVRELQQKESELRAAEQRARTERALRNLNDENHWQAREKLQQEIEKLSADIAALQQWVADQANTIQQQAARIGELMTENEAEGARAAALERAVGETRTQVEERVAENQQLQDHNRELQMEVAGKTTETDRLQERVRVLERDYEEARAQVADHTVESQHLRRELAAAQQLAEQRSRDLGAVQTEVASKKVVIDRLKNEGRLLRKQNVRRGQYAATLQNEAVELREQVGDLERAQEAHLVTIDQQAAALGLLQQQQGELEARTAQLQAEKRSLEERLAFALHASK